MKLTQLTDRFWPPAGARHRVEPDTIAPSNPQAAQIPAKASEIGLPFVEMVGVDRLGGHVAAWADLAARALEPNVFLEPSFALPAARHLPEAKGAGFLLAWDESASSPRGQLLALWPIAPHGAIYRLKVKTWVHDFCCSGAPLLDRTRAFDALDALINFLNESMRRACALTTSQLKKDGPTFALLSCYASARGLQLRIVSQYDRAVLDGAMGLTSADLISSRKKKELQRQYRKLCERGPVAFGVSGDAATLRQEVESFLALEARGWKGRGGGAFLNRPEQTAFLRTMTRAMGAEGKCRVYWMACGAKVIVANIVLLKGGFAYFWKTAYDEDFAFASPGVLLAMNMTEALLREPQILAGDSCAAPGHPMIDHIWRGRTRLADVMLSLHRDKMRAFHGAVQREQIRLKLRETAKSALRRLNRP